MKKKRISLGKIIIHAFFIVFSLTFILPILSVLSISLTDEATLGEVGYSLIPKKVSVLAYTYIFANPQKIIDGYAVTIFVSAVGTFLSLLVVTSVSYALSRITFVYRKAINYYFLFTLLFSGGLVPLYILNTQYLKLGDSIWIYIIPSLVNVWNVIVVRTFMQQDIPTELIEAAKMDGASEYCVYLQIILPLSKPVIATIGLLTLLGKWNMWQESMLYIRNTRLYTLQYLLQRMLLDAQFAQQMSNTMPGSISMTEAVKVPSESMRFAMCVLAAGPMLVVFPFFQKYFSKGLTIGAVKS